MKRLLLAFVTACVLVSSAYAEGMRMGSLTQQNMTEEEFAAFIKSQERNFFGWKILNTHHRPEDTFTYYESLTAMLMALNSGKIDEAALPEPAAEYVVNTNQAFEMSCALHSRKTYLALGFKNDDKGLRLCKMFNEALASMRADLKLSILTAEYLSTPGKSQPNALTYSP